MRRRPAASTPAGTGAGAAETDAGTASRYEPVLAARFRIDPDGSGLELWLRSGVRFHDGRPLSAFDVRATLDMVRSAVGGAPRTQALLADFARVQVLNKELLRIDLRHDAHRASLHRGRRGGAIDALLSALSEIDILPANYFASGRLLHQPWNRRPVCTGPFRFADWHRGSYISLRKNPGYWGPPPAVSELRFLISTDGARGLSLLRKGEADVLGRVAPRYLEDQVEPAVRRGRFRKVEIDANQLVVLVPNGRHPLLGQAAVRRALGQALDKDRVREKIVRDLRHGLGTPLQPPGKDSAALAPAPPSPAALVPLAPTLFPGRLGLLVPAGATELSDAARRIADALLKIDVKLQIEVVDLPTFVGRLRRGAFELALCAFSWTGSLADADLEPLFSYAMLGSAEWRGGELLAELLSRGKTDTASRLLSRFQEEAPLFLLYEPRQMVLLGPQIEPAQPPLSGDFLDLRRLGKQASAQPPRFLDTALR